MSNAICGDDYPSPFMGRDKEERASLVLTCPVHSHPLPLWGRTEPLHPSPLWGGWREAPGGVVASHTATTPTRHIVRFARDVPPSPTSGRDKRQPCLSTLVMVRRTTLTFFIPPLLWGGWRPKASRVGLSPHTSLQPPTRHIVRAAHDVPPSPQRGRDKKKRSRLDPHKWEG